MKKNYYYNNQIVRSSENEYTHGIIFNGKVIACCSRYDLALKRLHKESLYQRKVIEDERKWLIKNHEAISETVAKEYLNKLLTRFETLHIVELEQR